MDQEYSNREIDDKLEHIHEKLDSIIIQTTKTNGSVAKVTGEFNRWKYIIIGFCSCISIIMLPLLWALISGGKI